VNCSRKKPIQQVGIGVLETVHEVEGKHVVIAGCQALKGKSPVVTCGHCLRLAGGTEIGNQDDRCRPDALTYIHSPAHCCAIIAQDDFDWRGLHTCHHRKFVTQQVGVAALRRLHIPEASCVNFD